MSVSEPLSHGVRTNGGELDTSKIGKRNRPPRSCEPCRIRKLKCNRGLPCDSCIKRSKEASCEYAANADRSKTDTGRNSKPGDRLQRLEDLVLQFLENGVSQTPPGLSNDTSKTSITSGSSAPSGKSDSHSIDSQNDSPEIVNGAATGEGPRDDTHGLLDVHGGQTNYVDSTHWLSILDEIKEVREQMSPANIVVREDQTVDNGVDIDQDVDLLFGPIQNFTIQDVLRSLPPRHTCDSLLSYYFNTKYMVLPIVHPQKFQREYEIFWRDPSKAPVLWIGLLFSILGLAASLRQAATALAEFGGSSIALTTFKLKAAHCLVLGKYAIPKAYGLETLMLHLQSNYLAMADSNVNVWVLMGVIIRLTMRMGYHRDPKHYPNISPFEGEMRRRLWQTVFQLDVLMSFQMGLPSMVPSEYCDTEIPSNLNYSDFWEGIEALPPSRPLSDHTSALYIIVKSKIMAVFKKIIAHTSCLHPVPYEETMALDGLMRDTYNAAPADLKMRPITRSFTDASSTIMNRCNIELLFLKSIVVLHRKYVNMDRSNPRYEYSRGVCLEAALDILARQADIYQASQPGGQLYDDRWMLSSLTAHDFLLAAMVVCLELSECMRVTPPEQLSVSPLNLEGRRATKLEALETSQRIWAASSSRSKDARTAAEALDLMVKKVKSDIAKKNTLNQSAISQQQSGSVSLARDGHVDYVDYNPLETDLPYAVPMSEMIDVPENLDWALLDQYFVNYDQVASLNMYDESQDFFSIPPS